MPRVDRKGPALVAPLPRPTGKPAATPTDAASPAPWRPAARPERTRLTGPRAVEGLQYADPRDFHVPTLSEAFALATRFPGKPIFLDTKLPPDDEPVARRMAQQYMTLFRQYPQLRDQAFIGTPNAKTLAVIKDEFARAPDFAGFKNFTLDHEDLSNFVVGHRATDAAPLKGAGDNRYLSIGAPYKPLPVGSFEDLLTLTRQTMARTRDPASPDFGKKLCVWTIDDEKQMRALAKAAPDYILTDNPALLNKVLDETYGPSGADRLGPKVMCHRGGPDGTGAPENTLPMMEHGFKTGQAIEIDICSAKDGAVVMHDNDPHDVIATLRRAGGGVGEFKPQYAASGPNVSRKRMDQLTTAEIQGHYHFVKDDKGAVANVETGLSTVGRLLGNLFR